ncbi:hypothetical protein [Chromohalobacter japonicus]|uniref:hypothetical protein n=1 Tax=Chromohalobacter japonicus TaxID=223900 RepID=UPI001FF6E094|nr:hypothetical protein [Chromohalobacter japonicus]MCK0751737.1 hypothetical protein [Chromohalobacter japonicus]
MGLSPYLVAQGLCYEEVACLLSGDDPREVMEQEPEYHAGQRTDFFLWKVQIINAIKRRELEALWIRKYGLQETFCPQASWFYIKHSDLVEVFFEPDHLRIGLEKREVARWLKSCGLPDDDIPAPLRTSPAPNLSSEVEKPTHSPEGEELRALAALGLLVETFATKFEPRYRKTKSGRPSCAQIAAIMESHAGDVYGTKKGTLERRLGDALDAWEKKRG